MFPVAPLQFHLFMYYSFSTCFQGQSSYFLWLTNYHSQVWINLVLSIIYLFSQVDLSEFHTLLYLIHFIFKTFNLLHIYFKIGTYYLVLCSCFFNSSSKTFLIGFVKCWSSQSIIRHIFENFRKYIKI